MTDFNADESARLIACMPAAEKEWTAEAFEAGDTTPSAYIDGWNEAIADWAGPLADQLEAAAREVERLRLGLIKAEIANSSLIPGAMLTVTEIACLTAERDDLRAQVAKLTEERDEMRAVVEAIDACVDDDARTDFTYCDEWKLVVSTVNAYRAAKEKP